MKFFNTVNFGGIKHERRNLEKIKGIENSYIPRQVCIPIYKNKGGLFISPKDKVIEGQLIGMGEKGEIHSSIPGTVLDIIDMEISGVTYKTAVIKLAGEFDITGKKINKFDWKSLRKETIVDMFINNGVNGYKLGYDFIHLTKMTLPKAPIENLIINAFDGDFSLYNSLAILKSKSHKVVEGIKILTYLFEPKHVIFVTENDYINYVTVLKKTIDEEKLNIEIKFLANQYPKSNDFLVYKTVTKIPAYSYKDILMQNSFIADIETTVLVADSIMLQRPIIERLVTVKDEDNIKVYNVKIGKNILEIIQEFAHIKSKKILIGGGYITGDKIDDLDRPLTKDLNSIIIAPDTGTNKQVECINCSHCIRNCPTVLEPIKLYRLINQNKISNVAELSKCINCKACTYVCPSNIPLSSVIYKKRLQLEKREEH